MDGSNGMGIARQRLLDNITLLWTLNEVPETPRENLLPESSDAARQLSIERERDLSDNIAFLSARTDDTQMVMAVCVEEDLDQAGLTIRMAANTGSLADVEDGLKNIAKMLEKAALRSQFLPFGLNDLFNIHRSLVNPRVEDERVLFREVVQFDSARILSRLRSRHAKRTRKTRGKPALLVLLDTSMVDSSIKPRMQVTADKLRQIRRKTANLRRPFFEFEDTLKGSEESVVVMMVLLQQIYELASEADLYAALAISKTLDPGLKHFLPEAAAKLGRYYTVSCDLVSAARGRYYRLFRRVSVASVDISLPSEILRRDHASFRSAVQNVFGPKQLRPIERHIETCLSQRLAAVEAAFQLRLSAEGNPWKVHAEIKILFYYELHPTSNRPRVLSSSKSACYLCNLFIKLHGDFYTPRTHGRLYDRWILPDWHEGIAPDRREKLSGAIQQFNAVLEKKIRLTLEARRASLNHPNESVLIPRVHWSSSVLHTPASSTISGIPFTEGEVGDRGKSVLNLAATASDSLPEPQTNMAANREQVPAPVSDTGTSKHRSSFDIGALSGDPAAVGLLSVNQKLYERLPRGKWRWERLPASTVFSVSTKSIHLTLSRDDSFCSGGNESEGATATCWVRVKWLNPDEQAAVDINTPNTVEVKGIRNGSQVTVAHGGFATNSELYVFQGHDMVSIKFELRYE